MPKFIELCAGAGGLSTGLIKAGFIPVLLNDNNKDCCMTLRKNHEEYADIVSCNSMNNLDLKQFKNIDLLAGGVPCQSFSYAGTKKGLNDNRGELILKFIEFINQITPKMFLIENVKGLYTHDKGKTLKYLLSLIKSYEIEYRILNSFDYLVPQKRERLIIVGWKKGLQFDFPISLEKKIVLKDVLFNVPKSLGSEYSEKKKVLFKIIPQGGSWINLPIELQKEYLGKSFDSGGGKRGILHRLDMNKPSLTLLCSPSQKQTERCHPLEDRPLTIREYARIQTFSDDYIFCGSISSCYKQIGNAIPVNMAVEIGNEIRKTLERRNDRFDE